MQKYRADRSELQSDGATVWRTEWIGGPTLAKIVNCRLENMEGDMRRTVYITGEADTFYSIPAVCRIVGCRVKGYVTSEDGNLVFRYQDNRDNRVDAHVDNIGCIGRFDSVSAARRNAKATIRNSGRADNHYALFASDGELIEEGSIRR